MKRLRNYRHIILIQVKIKGNLTGGLIISSIYYCTPASTL